MLLPASASLQDWLYRNSSRLPSPCGWPSEHSATAPRASTAGSRAGLAGGRAGLAASSDVLTDCLDDPSGARFSHHVRRRPQCRLDLVILACGGGTRSPVSWETLTLFGNCRVAAAAIIWWVLAQSPDAK